MKRTKRVFAFLMAAIFALALVPSGAWATQVSGRLFEDTGTITINNAQPGETYNAYRLFELASFTDDSDNLGDDQHSNDAYAYVIKTTSPWLNFLTGQWTGNSNQTLFEIDTSRSVEIGTTSYFVVKATEYFANNFSDTALVNKDETTAEEWHSTSLVHSFAQNAIGQAVGQHMTADATGMNNGDAPASIVLKDSSNETKLPLGYYVISSSAGTLCMLDTTNPNISIDDKNILPGVTKSVQEDSLSTSSTAGDGATSYTKTNDASIGDTVHFRTTVSVSKGAQNLSLHDKMDPGLSWTGASDLHVYLLKPPATLSTHDTNWIELKDGTTITLSSQSSAEKSYPTTSGSKPEKADYYSFASGQSGYQPAGGSITQGTFTLTFNSDFVTYLSNMIDSSIGSYTIVVTYDATLNRRATFGDTNGNVNRTYLTYGDNSKTAEELTHTATWEFDIRKFTTSNGTKDIDGAKFRVYLASDSQKEKPLKFVNNNNGQYRYDSRSAIQGATIPVPSNSEAIGDVSVQSPDNEDSSITLKVVDTLTTTNGKLMVFGLDGEEFILEEVSAPRGYNKLTSDIRFRIVDVDEAVTDPTAGTSANVSYSVSGQTKYATAGQVVNKSTSPATLAELNDGNKNVRLAIENRTGAELPSTGGIGTTIFYVVGGALVVGSAIMLVTKRRMASGE